MPRFHHKMPTDNWCNIMRVSYTVDESVIKNIDNKTNSSVLKPNDSDEKLLYHTIKELRNPDSGKGLKWSEVLATLAERQDNGAIRYPRPLKEMSNDVIRQKWVGLKRKFGLLRKTFMKL